MYRLFKFWLKPIDFQILFKRAEAVPIEYNIAYICEIFFAFVFNKSI